MTINESFTCPYCKEEKVAILNAASVMSDVRLDVLHCPKCETTWRVYSKVSEANIEIVSMPEKAGEAEAAETAAEETAEAAPATEATAE